MRRLAVRAVADREEVVRREGAEGGEWDRDPDDRTEHDVGEVVDAEVDAEHARDRDRARRRQLRPVPWPAGTERACTRRRSTGSRSRRSGSTASRNPPSSRAAARRTVAAARRRARDPGGELPRCRARSPRSRDGASDGTRRSRARAAIRAARTRRGTRSCAPGARARRATPPGTRRRASVTHASNRSSGAGSTRSHRHPVTTTPSSRTSQIHPVDPICLGSGGAAPVGRRRRRTGAGTPADGRTTLSRCSTFASARILARSPSPQEHPALDPARLDGLDGATEHRRT